MHECNCNHKNAETDSCHGTKIWDLEISTSSLTADRVYLCVFCYSGLISAYSQSYSMSTVIRNNENRKALK